MNVHSSSYACKCLNIRIFSRSTCSSDLSSPVNQWHIVDVGDDGIVIIHKEFTVRTRSKASPDPNDASRYIQYMSVTCMSCQCLVYRVLQSTSPNSECKEGPILPSEEWVEKEVLKSSSGRLEVHNDCLTQEAIARAESQPSFSRVFRIILPVEAKSLNVNVVNSQSPPNLPPITATHLPPLAPVFPPPPFTPSHPAFLHISSVAIAESEKIRASAEQYLAKVTLDKAREIEDQENQLRCQAEGLWVRFRETLEKFEAEKRDMSQKKRDSGKWVSSSRTTSPIKENSGTPVSVNDFVPTAVTVPRLNPSSGSITPRASALSTSLATTSFHHPRENMNSGSPSRRAPSSTSVETEGSLSTASSKTLANQGNQHLEEINDILEPFRRDMNEAKDVATSLLVLDLEAQMVRREQKRAAQEKAKAESDNQGNPPVGPSTQPQPQPSRPNGTARHTLPGLDDMSTPDNFVSSPENKKGKRKVTFDIQPDVVTIKRDVTKELDEQTTREAKRIQVSVFDLEDELRGDGNSDPPAELPLLDTTGQANRRKSNFRPRSSNAGGLPQSLSSLRPVSLPPPSTDRIPMHTRTNEAEALTDASHVQQPDPDHLSDEGEMDLQPSEVELMKLVAADTPSHRGAWKKGGKAWERLLTSQSDGIHREKDTLEDEELTSVDNWNDEYGWSLFKPDNVAYSLPVTIGSSLGKGFGPKLYQAKNSLSDRPGFLVPKFPNNRGTSESLRRAVYAERDRSREIDPGTLDFSTSSDSPGLDDEGQDVLGELNEGRGHQYALRILQARNELPEPGMWRSLA